MTADVELLPLPEWQGDFMTESEFREEADAYARANVAHATAARDTEIEALRAQNSDLKAASEYTKAHRENAARNQNGIIKALTEIRDEQGAEIHRLRAELETAQGQAEFYRTTRNWSQQKAERLAEALRECRDDYAHALGLSKQLYQEWCSRGAYGSPPNDTWPRHCQRRKEQIDALLHPTAAQENGRE